MADRVTVTSLDAADVDLAAGGDRILELQGDPQGSPSFQGLSGSLVIGLAATRDAQPITTLWDLSRIDETWQAEQWGVDEEAAEAEAVKRESFLHAKRFYDSARIAE